MPSAVGHTAQEDLVSIVDRPSDRGTADTIVIRPMLPSSGKLADQAHGPDLFEIIKTIRSMRRLKPDPVPNELVRKILEAGVCAPERRKYFRAALARIRAHRDVLFWTGEGILDWYLA